MKAKFSSAVVMDELLVIELSDPTLFCTSTEYLILNAEQKIARRGSFRGLAVQMHIGHLSDGRYQIKVVTSNRQEDTHSFEKRSVLTSPGHPVRVPKRLEFSLAAE